MTTSTLAPFSLVILLSYGLARAGTDAGRVHGPQPAGSTVAASATSGSGVTAAPNADYRMVPGTSCGSRSTRTRNSRSPLQVRPDGKVTLPLIGDIAAEGRTSIELRDALVTSLKEYNTNPVVTVIVVETVPPMFYVMGEVNAPGSLPLKGQITVLQALAMAGGFKDFAKTNKIVIQRKGAAGITTLKFNYNDAVQGQGSDHLPEARRHDHRSVTAVKQERHDMKMQWLRHTVIPAILLAGTAGSAAAQESSSEFTSWRTPGWSFTPGVTVAGGFDSNVALASAPADTRRTQSDRLFIAEPFAQLEFVSPRTEFSSGYQSYVRRYVDVERAERLRSSRLRLAAAARHEARDVFPSRQLCGRADHRRSAIERGAFRADRRADQRARGRDRCPADEGHGPGRALRQRLGRLRSHRHVPDRRLGQRRPDGGEPAPDRPDRGRGRVRHSLRGPE